jgi:hypothetical protein
MNVADLTPDLKYYAYFYNRFLADLYVITGLK